MKINALIKIIVLLVLLILTACATAEKAVETQVVQEPTATPTLSFSYNQEIEAYWRRGPHSKIQIQPADLENSCAACHSPRDWDPTRPPERASDCAAALINAGQGAVGGASDQLIDISTWHAVDCKVCHRHTDEGEFDGELAFWNQASGEYEGVKNSSELCQKCHRKSEGIDLSVDMGQGVHASLECIVCHEPHRGNASCTNSGCHADVNEELIIIKDLAVLPGHETVSPHSCGGAQCHTVATQVAEENRLPHIGIHHGNLTCSACHDAAGLEVAPIEESQEWTTWRPLEWEDREGSFPQLSHNIQKEVDCTHCHYPDNPWRLSTLSGVGPP